MLAYVRHLLNNYVHQDIDSLPSHEFYQLLTSEYLETFHAAFANTITVESAEEDDLGSYFKTEYEASQVESSSNEDSSEPISTTEAPTDVPVASDCIDIATSVEKSNSVENSNTLLEPPPTGRLIATQILGKTIQCDSPTRSDEGYGSYSGESYEDRSHEHDHDDGSDEIAALGIIEEGDEVPDYGVALEPTTVISISPRRPERSGSTPQNRHLDQVSSPTTSPTKQKLSELSGPTPKPYRGGSTKAGMSENARNILTMGYTLSLLGEKMDRARSIEGSVKSVILKAGQAIEKSQAGSVQGKSRYNGSRYGGSRYGGSKFGGSKRSVARSVVLEESLPAWGF